MNKLILIFIISYSFSYGQENSKEVLEPIAFSRACLDVAIKPPPDTLDCYPYASKRWLTLIEEYVKQISIKFDLDKKKALETEQQKWLKEMESEFNSTNEIIENKDLPLIDRRKAAVKQFKFGQKRAEYLLTKFEN